MKEQRSYYSVKFGALQRYIVWYYLPGLFRHIRVTEFPKSGGTWLCQLLSETLALPFPQNKMMTFQKGIQHTHLPGPIGRQKTILMVRDGRDVVVSAYYHFILGHEGYPKFITDKWRKLLDVSDYTNIEKHLPKFINIFFSNYKVGGKQMNWARFLDTFDLTSSKLKVVKYEDMLIQPDQELRQLLDWLNYDNISDIQINKAIDKYSFKNRTGREPGDESEQSFLRKGIAGDWKNKFSSEAIRVFDKWAGHKLEELGYHSFNFK